MERERERLRRLVEELPEREIHAAERYLEYLSDLGSDTVLFSLDTAPDDDGMESPEEAAAVERARGQLARGETVPDDEVWRRLGHEPRR